jgi:hypothetical protein
MSRRLCASAARRLAVLVPELQGRIKKARTLFFQKSLKKESIPLSIKFNEN